MNRILSFASIAIAIAASLTSAASASPSKNGLPSGLLTPGAINLAVNQSNIESTICVSGYTATVRPKSSVTTRIKREQLASGYNLLGDVKSSDYEEDHLVPLELGGNPTSMQNLWPEPRKIAWGATKKDRLENKLHALVCSGQLSLRAAQKVFETNWISGYLKYVGP